MAEWIDPKSMASIGKQIRIPGNQEKEYQTPGPKYRYRKGNPFMNA
jgi:hypothetical protein